MKLSRQWLSDDVDLSGVSDEELVRRLTDIGHALESLETRGDDTIFDLEITTNRVDAMSHFGMGRELAAAFGRDLGAPASSRPAGKAAAAPPAATGSGRIAADQQRRRRHELRDAGPRPSAPRIRPRQARRRDGHRA